MRHKEGCQYQPERQIGRDESGMLVEILSCECGAIGIKPFIPLSISSRIGNELKGD